MRVSNKVTRTRGLVQFGLSVTALTIVLSCLYLGKGNTGLFKSHQRRSSGARPSHRRPVMARHLKSTPAKHMVMSSKSEFKDRVAEYNEAIGVLGPIKNKKEYCEYVKTKIHPYYVHFKELLKTIKDDFDVKKTDDFAELLIEKGKRSEANMNMNDFRFIILGGFYRGHVSEFVTLYEWKAVESGDLDSFDEGYFKIIDKIDYYFNEIYFLTGHFLQNYFHFEKYAPFWKDYTMDKYLEEMDKIIPLNDAFLADLYKLC